MVWAREAGEVLKDKRQAPAVQDTIIPHVEVQ